LSDDREEPHVSSTLRWKDVRLPRSVTEADLDALIFSVLNQNWRKTARIVGSTLELCEARLIEVSAEVIAARIQDLVETGKIEGVGDLSKWRHSEVRRRQS
jgi:hypothetical protein